MTTLLEVKTFLEAQGLKIAQYECATPDSHSAAQAVGCEVGQIAKTVLFMVGESPVVVVASGDVRVKGGALKRATGLGGRVRLSTPQEVALHTGYAPGGVCPFLLPVQTLVVLDKSLERFHKIYPAGGDDHSAVETDVETLLKLTGAKIADVCGTAGGNEC